MAVQSVFHYFISAHSGKMTNTLLGWERRLSLSVVVGLVGYLSLPSAVSAELRRYEYSADAMGGAYSITLYSASRDIAIAAAAAAFVELRRLDRMLSNYRPESEWSEVNRSAAKHPVRISKELFNLLSECLKFSQRSEGAFDITVGPLVKTWGFYDGSGHMADDATVHEALARVGYRHVLLDSANRTVRFARAGVEIDPGGIGKGYAVDCMIGVLKRNGIERALVSAAGSSIYGLGKPPNQEGWPVRLSLPGRTEREGVEFLLKNESLSTSGSARKFFRFQGKIYGHIIDPRTGYPVHGTLLTAVAAPCALDSEAWTKAFYVNGRRWSAEHIPAGFRLFFCEENGSHPLCGFLPQGSSIPPK